jgi:hypothetical protein
LRTTTLCAPLVAGLFFFAELGGEFGGFAGGGTGAWVWVGGGAGADVGEAAAGSVCG